MSDLSWGHPLIENQILHDFFNFISFLVSEKFYIIASALIYWCYDRKLGRDIALLICLSYLLNHILKISFQFPRPNTNLILQKHDPFSFPSGEMQALSSICVALAWHYKKPILWLGFSLIIILVGLSRNYLGFHYPQDIVVGAILGALAVPIYYWLKSSAVCQWLKVQQAYLTLLLILGFMLYFVVIQKHINIISLKASGILLGIFLGDYLANKFLQEPSKTNLKDKIIAAIVGYGTLILLYDKLTHLMLKTTYLQQHFLINLILAVHIMFVAPWLIRKAQRFFR